MPRDFCSISQNPFSLKFVFLLSSFLFFFFFSNSPAGILIHNNNNKKIYDIAHSTISSCLICLKKKKITPRRSLFWRLSCGPPHESFRDRSLSFFLQFSSFSLWTTSTSVCRPRPPCDFYSIFSFPPVE